MEFILEIVYLIKLKHWIALYSLNNNITYFDNFSIEHIPKEIKKSIDNKNITTTFFRKKANISVMCGKFCIGFIDFMVKDKILSFFTK